MLKCNSCQKEYSVDEPIWRCECGNVLDITLPLIKDECKHLFESISTPTQKAEQCRRDLKELSDFGQSSSSWQTRSGLWRYRRLIPIERDENIVSLGEGRTPLVPFVGHDGVYFKLDYLMPSGSFKDRGASVLISKVKEVGVRKIVEDSSGNAGAAIAGYCAAAGIECEIFVPANSSPVKLAQIEMYGAEIHKINGSRENVANTALQAADKTYYASHSWNPFFFEGTKTIAFELYEQLGCRAPDTMILPVGNGTLLLGICKGFAELAELSLIEKPPRLIAVQSENCAPLFEAFHKNESDITTFSETASLSGEREIVAEGICVARPIRGEQILQAVKDSGGTFLTVSNLEIGNSLIDLCSRGFYIEPTAAVAPAALNKYRGKNGEVIVIVLTGSGLKASDKIITSRREHV